MNILVISSILPVPPAIPDNDFIYHLYGNYRKLYPDDRIVIIKPVKYDFNLITILKGKTRIQKLKNKFEWKINDFQVEIFPFFSAWTVRDLHALVTRSCFHLNRTRINRLVERYRFGILHARFVFPDAMLASQISKRYMIPYVVSTHNELFYFKHCYSRTIGLRILREASLLLPASSMNIEYFKSRGISNVHQFTHGFYDSFIKPQKKEDRKVVQILTVARLLQYKNIDKVLHALVRLKDRFDFHYTVIGDGPEKEKLRKIVHTAGLDHLVTFIERVPYERIADMMYQYDIFILTSYFETFGRVYFEVMAMGIPVICAKNSGIYGLFREKEEGISVDHRNTDEIADALALLINNREERWRIGKNGQELVQNFTWENLARDLHSKYVSCLTEKIQDIYGKNV